MAARIEENEHIRGEHVFFFFGLQHCYLHTYTQMLSICLSAAATACCRPHSFIHSVQRGEPSPESPLLIFFNIVCMNVFGSSC